MKIIITILFFLISSFYGIAEPISRGKYSDMSDDYSGPSNLIIGLGIIILVIIVIPFLSLFIVAFWKKNHEKILKILGIIVILTIVLFIGVFSDNETRPNRESIQQSFTPTFQENIPSEINQSQQEDNITPIEYFETETYLEECEECGGEGGINCPHCHGRGMIFEKCESCESTGYIKYNGCLQCILNGDNPPSPNCPSCNGTGSAYGRCEACKGMGEKIRFCEYCDAYTHHIVCPSCNGQGFISKTREVRYYQ